MKKDIRLIIVLFSSAIILGVILFIFAQPVSLENERLFKEENRARLEENHQKDLKSLVDDFDSFLSSPVRLPADLDALQGRLGAIRAPRPEFKDLHLSLALAMEGVKKYLENGDEKEIVVAAAAIEKARADYSWLK